eukprot:gnl/TRDRNA2_/TRDRNA2_176392_c0_seq30.p1 gnl/TRDRNA2_/TRDRNA2_176392_c0~~gnl/TRDRNA2_/TRDRNA2_176392_c0_seq30.p1  ORF type:complete len:465 (-),score=56.34 gnl/TRDRNA2_/TRDRNA2_176392_c0_seq30:62-1456(-)
MTSMFIILAAMLACLKAENAAETTCLMGSMVANCSDFEAFVTKEYSKPVASDESLNLLQTKAVLSNPPNADVDKRKLTKVYISRPNLTWGRRVKVDVERPLWQKTLRCSGPTMDDCEECVGNSSCWGDCKPGLALGRDLSKKEEKRRLGGIDRCVQVDSQNKWARFVTLIHVRCETRMHVRFRPTEVSGGVINLYWDDEPLTTFDRKIVWPKYWQTRLTTDHQGGNTFIVEFVPNSTDAVAEFTELGFVMRNEFTTCLDSKACLDRLGDEAGLPLRTSSVLMHQCLKTGMDNVSVQSVAGSCKKWKACLKKSDPSGEYERRLLTMLEASGVATAATAHSSLKQHLPPPQLGKGSGKCIYPPHEDPLSWNCDCYEDMMQRCKDIGASMEMEVCLRAQFCEHPHTCQHWKDSTCNEQKVADMSRRLKSALLEMDGLNSLMTRVSQKDTKATLAADLDHTTGHKACA